MNCKNCGYTLEEGNNICPNCRMTNVPNNITVENDIPEEEKAPETVIDSPIPEQVTPEPVVETPVVEQPTPEVFVSDTNTTTTEKKSNKTVIIVIIIVVALLVVGGGIFFTVRFLNNLNPFARKKITTTQTTQTRKKTADNSTTSPYKTRKSKSNPKVYVDMSNMTAKEMVVNVLDLTEISNGDKAYNYTDRFIYESPNYILLNKQHTFGKAGSWSFKDFSKDSYITHVSIYNVEEKDDGTLVIKNNPQVQVSIEFKNGDMALAVLEEFTTLFNEMGEVYTKPKDDGESVHVTYDKNDYFVSLTNPDKEGRPYRMYAWIPIMYFMLEK